MKKTFLLILTSLVLFACQKEDTELMENGLSVTHEYTCPNCGAKYSVTCKNPNIGREYYLIDEGSDSDVWQLINNPSWGGWTVEKVENGVKEYFPYYESLSNPKMYFKCSCGRTKEYSYKDFQTQRVSL